MLLTPTAVQLAFERAGLTTSVPIGVPGGCPSHNSASAASNPLCSVLTQTFGAGAIAVVGDKRVFIGHGDVWSVLTATVFDSVGAADSFEKGLGTCAPLKGSPCNPPLIRLQDSNVVVAVERDSSYVREVKDAFARLHR
jgi:hypothetical protein